MLRSALLNLIMNAAQAMPSGGKITISALQNNKKLEIRVIDEGSGIPAEHLEKIFSPFFTTKPKGNGFGLAEVHKIVQAHNGIIEVTSEVKKGTTFTLKLPMTNR